MSFLTREKNGARGDTILWGCAHKPRGILWYRKRGFLVLTYYTTMDAILQIEKNIIFLTFSIYFSKKIGFMEKIVQKKEKNLGLQF